MYLELGLGRLVLQDAGERILRRLDAAAVGVEGAPGTVLLHRLGAFVGGADDPAHALVAADDAAGSRLGEHDADGYGVDDGAQVDLAGVQTSQRRFVVEDQLP